MVNSELSLKEVGFRITQARAGLKLTVPQFADIAGVSKVALYDYERGVGDNIHFNTLVKIANALEVDLMWLCYGDVDSSDEINSALKNSYQKVFEFPLTYKVHLLDMIEIMNDQSDSMRRKSDHNDKMFSRLSRRRKPI